MGMVEKDVEDYADLIQKQLDSVKLMRENYMHLQEYKYAVERNGMLLKMMQSLNSAKAMKDRAEHMKNQAPQAD